MRRAGRRARVLVVGEGALRNRSLSCPSLSCRSLYFFLYFFVEGALRDAPAHSASFACGSGVAPARPSSRLSVSHGPQPSTTSHRTQSDAERVSRDPGRAVLPFAGGHVIRGVGLAPTTRSVRRSPLRKLERGGEVLRSAPAESGIDRVVGVATRARARATLPTRPPCGGGLFPLPTTPLEAARGLRVSLAR